MSYRVRYGIWSITRESDELPKVPEDGSFTKLLEDCEFKNKGRSSIEGLTTKYIDYTFDSQYYCWDLYHNQERSSQFWNTVEDFHCHESIYKLLPCTAIDILEEEGYEEYILYSTNICAEIANYLCSLTVRFSQVKVPLSFCSDFMRMCGLFRTAGSNENLCVVMNLH